MPFVSRFVFAAAVAFPAVVAAQVPDPCATAPQTCATLINTHASAETRIPNTAVDITVAIATNGKDMPTVQRQLANKSTSLLAYLRGEKVLRLITNGVSFTPETKESHSTVDKTVGYDGSSTVSFRTTPDRAPDLLSGVLGHSANTIESVQFTPTEEEIAAARRELSAEATRKALEQADSIAKAAGMRVVSIRSINLGDGATAEVRVQTAGFGGDRAVGPMRIGTASGEQLLSVNVDITAAAFR